MKSELLSTKAKLLVAALAAIIWFAFLGHRDLIEPDEGRYAEIPREMVASGDWVTPRLNGFKYFEKPALQYWMTAISFKLFGQSNATARLWIAVAGFACGLFVWYLGVRLFDPEAGFYGFIITVSGLFFVGMGHLLTLDMTLSLFTVVGVGALAIAQSGRQDPVRVRNWMLIGWAALAGAVMTKGLIGIVLPGGAVLVYSLWQRDWALWKHLHLGKGLLLFLALTAPWFVTVSLANEDFARFFFIHEHFERYTTTVHRHQGPLYYFIPLFMLGVVPWLWSSLRAIFRPAFKWRPAAGAGFDAVRFLWVFAVLTFVFFSLGKSKLPPYILPIMPVVALLAGRELSEKTWVRGDAWSMLLVASGCLIAGALITRLAGDNLPVELLQNVRGWIIAGALILGFGALVLFKVRKRAQLGIAVAGICAMLGYQVFFWGYQEVASERSSREIADAIKRNDLSEVPVYAVDNYPQSLPFYLGRTIQVVSFVNELEMGIKAEPEKWLATWDDFMERWQSDKQAVAVLRTRDLKRFTDLGLPMRTIYHGARKIVVAKQ